MKIAVDAFLILWRSFIEFFFWKIVLGMNILLRAKRWISQIYFFFMPTISLALKLVVL